MTNEMKLITALCDLLEIDVEEVVNYAADEIRTGIDVGSGENTQEYTLIPFEYEYKLTKKAGSRIKQLEEALKKALHEADEWSRESGGCQGADESPNLEDARSLLREEGTVTLPVLGDVWGAMVKYVLAHSSDIEADINDYGDLQPVLDYFKRAS